MVVKDNLPEKQILLIYNPCLFCRRTKNVRKRRKRKRDREKKKRDRDKETLHKMIFKTRKCFEFVQHQIFFQKLSYHYRAEFHQTCWKVSHSNDTNHYLQVDIQIPKTKGLSSFSNSILENYDGKKLSTKVFDFSLSWKRRSSLSSRLVDFTELPSTM